MTSISLPERVRVLVVGAGFAGLGTAIKLDEHGFGDFLVVDKGQTVGGTWRDNTYPGAACDVPSQLYSFSFAPNPDWSRSFSPQPEIQAYLERTARDVRRPRPVPLRRHRRGRRLGRGRAASGASAPTTARSPRTSWSPGPAGSREPKLPEIEGIDSFAGEIFHSARWNHDYDLTGKRVAVIGTGASAIQIVPEVAKQAAHLDVYQRTAPWVMPRGDRAYKRDRAVRVPPPAVRAEGLPHRHLLGSRVLRPRASRSTPSWPRRRRSWRCRTSSAASPTPSCARRSRRTSRSAASAS